MDTLGHILWFLAWITPLFTFPIAWHLVRGSWMVRILAGLILALLASAILYYSSLLIIFRHGMGPV